MSVSGAVGIEVFALSNGEGERPRRSADPATRAHNVPTRPRRQTDRVSRPPPTIVRRCHIRTKYGIAMSPIPSMTSRVVLETKYGKIIKVSPQTSGTTLFCLLPYTKKPSPIEPNSNPQRRDDVSKAPNGEVGGPRRSATQAPRAHAVFPRPRRATTDRSRSPPTIVRRRGRSVMAADYWGLT
jgi:hypothetical protein